MTPVVYRVIRMAGGQCAPVTVEGERIQFKHPFDRPSLVFEGNKITATAEGEFVAVWEKVQ
jgi:hypothetical protein